MDDTVPTGYTIGTDPPVGSVVQNLPDTVVTVYISSARRNYDRVVPSVVGMSSEAAARVLQDVDLQLGPITEEHNEAEAGTILAQNPAANQTQSIGSLVYVTVSLGPEAPAEDPAAAAAGGSVGVPSVVGMSQDAAAATLAAAGLPAQVNTVASDQAAGTVIGQAPGGGSVPPGTAVVLTVSSGPAPTPTPEPTPTPTE